MYDLDAILRETFVACAEHHPTLGSTNDRAAQYADLAETELPRLILADRQSAGRGRGSNRWWTGPGSLAFSLLVDARTVGAERGPAPLTALAAAVAIVETVDALSTRNPVGIHWPNDIMAGGRKLAGILIEALPNRRHVIGIGMNVNVSIADAPTELQPEINTLRELCGRDFDLTRLLIALVQRLDRRFALLRDEPQTIAASANSRCLQHDCMLTIRQGSRTISGRCRGIAPDGALLLETSSGMESFYSGTLEN